MEREELKNIIKNFNEGAREEKISKKNASMILIEILLISFFISIVSYGYYGKMLYSILAFFITDIGLVVLLMSTRKAAIIFSGVFSLFWGAFGYSIGTLFKSIILAAILAIICFLISYKKHIDGIGWIND